MPCATVHLYLSDRVLDHWEAHPGRAPFPARDPAHREAFRHGALAPDMGFVPGVERFASDLAHYCSPADLARALLRGSPGSLETAFAWGWTSHVVGDVLLHPLVGRAVGEWIHGDRKRRMNAEEDLPTHVGMEVGLDLSLLERAPAISPPPATPFLGRSNVGVLREALERTYGVPWSPGRLLAGHRRAVRLTRRWPRAIRLVERSGRDGRAGRDLAGAALGLVVRTGRSLARPDSALRGFLEPIPPPRWLVDRVEAFGDELPTLLDPLVPDGAESLENRNLETGEEAGPGRGHPPSDAAVRELERRRRAEAGDLVKPSSAT